MKIPSHFRHTLLAICLSAAAVHAGWTEDYAILLKKYSTPAGVHFATWKQNAADTAALDGIVKAVATQPPEENLSYYLNAYNAWMLHEALQGYPTVSIKELAATPERIEIGGRKMSFNQLEDAIYEKFQQPRALFAIYRATRGSPALRLEPYQEPTLMTVLGLRVGKYVNDPQRVRVSQNELGLSELFKWHQQLFPKGAPEFMNTFRKNHLPDVKVVYYDYDWTLDNAL